MDPERGDANVYELVTQLVRHTLRRNRTENGSSYVPPTSDIRIVRRFRSRAYEILLNKSNKTYNQGTLTCLTLMEIKWKDIKEKNNVFKSLCRTQIIGNAAGSESDPLLEVLKHAFVLRLSLRRMSEAKELESLINKLYTQERDAVVATLQLLLELKNFQTDTEAALVFISLIRSRNRFPEFIPKLMRIKFCLGHISLW